MGEKLVQLLDQPLHGRQEFDQPLRNQYRPEVHSCLRPTHHGLGDIGHHIVQIVIVGLHLFGYDTDIGVGLEGALQCNMRCRTPHQLDEVPVLPGRIAIALDITDQFAIDFGGRVEAEGGFYLFVFQVAVDRLRTADHLYSGIDRGIVLGQDAGVGVGVVATDDDQCLDVQLSQYLQSGFELFGLVQLGTSGSDHVEAPRIAVFIYYLSSQFAILMLDQAIRSHKKSEEPAIGVEQLHLIEQTGYHIVSTRSLSARKDNPHIRRRILRPLSSRCERNKRQAVCAGKNSSNLFFVRNRLRSFSFYYLHCSLQRCRHFRLVGHPRQM